MRSIGGLFRRVVMCRNHWIFDGRGKRVSFSPYLHHCVKWGQGQGGKRSEPCGCPHFMLPAQRRPPVGALPALPGGGGLARCLPLGIPASAPAPALRRLAHFFYFCNEVHFIFSKKICYVPQFYLKKPEVYLRFLGGLGALRRPQVYACALRVIPPLPPTGRLRRRAACL